MSDYVISRMLGQGGFGAVYLARHVPLDRDVAIKFLHAGDKGVAQSDEIRFLREIRILKELSHPGIVKILDAGRADGRPYYVMELIEARDLDTVIQKDGPLSIPVAIGLLDQMLDALDYLHGRSILHRDIKCANVMVESGGRAILMDFGLSRGAEHTVVTREGAVLGTPRYFAPEVLTRGEMSPASDLWSLGVVMYRVLTGHRAFDGETLPDMMRCIMQENPTPPDELRREIPEALARLLEKFYAKSLEERWSSAALAREALHELEEQGLVPAGVRPTRPAAILGALGGADEVTQGAAPAPGKEGPPSRPSRPVSGRTPAVGRTGRMSGAVRAAPDGVGETPRRAPQSLQPMTAGRRPGAVSLAVAGLVGAAAILGLWVLRPGAPTGLDVSPVHPVTPNSPATRNPAPATALERLARVEKVASTMALRLESTWMAVMAALRKDDPKLNPQEPIPVLARFPRARGPFEAFVARLDGELDLGATRAIVPELSRRVGDPKTTSAERARLMNALAVLDGVDVLGVRLGLAPIFGVGDAMKSLLRISVFTKIEGPGGNTTACFPAAGGKGADLYIPREIPAEVIAEMVSLGDEAFNPREPKERRLSSSKLMFTLDSPPNADGRILDFQISHLGQQVRLRLQPPGEPWAVPVRIPDDFNGRELRLYWIRVHLAGPLAAPRGRWSVTQERIWTRDLLRPYVSIYQIRAGH